MIYFFDKNEQFLNRTDNFENDLYKRQINKEHTFTFDIDLKDENINYIKRKNKIGLYNKENEFQLFVIEDIEFDYFNNIATIVCLHDFYSLNDSIIESLQLNDVSAKTAINNILNKSSYTTGHIVELGTDSINIYFKSILNALNTVVNIYGGELDFKYELAGNKISKKIINLKYRLGEDTGLRFTYDTNLKSIKKNINKDNHFTVLYGHGYSLGKDKYGNDRFLNFEDIEWNENSNPTNKPIGDKFIEDKKAIAKYGRIEGVFQDTNIKKRDILIQKTYEKLQECKEPKISYSATVEEISNITGYKHYKSQLGDTIIILDEEHNLTIEARILEEEYSIKDITDIKIVLGNFSTGLTDEVIDDLNDIKDKVDNIDIEVDNSKFPDTLPDVPVISAYGIFSNITLEWSYENKLYYNYEVYASKIKNFDPDSTNLIYKGQASAFLHEVKPRETWYYRVRAGNTHNKFTEFSSQVSASTSKLSDAAEYFEEAAINHALIGSLDADKIIAGKVKGTFINAKDLLVDDGNGVRTLHVDSFGRVHINATVFSLQGKSISSIANSAAYSAVEAQTQRDIFNKLTNNGQTQGIYLQNGKLYVNGDYIQAGTVSCERINTPTGSQPIIRLFGSYCSIDATKFNESGGFGNAIRLKLDRENYVAVVDGKISIFTSGFPGKEIFIFRGGQNYAEMFTQGGTLSFDYNKIKFNNTELAFKNHTHTAHDLVFDNSQSAYFGNVNTGNSYSGSYMGGYIKTTGKVQADQGFVGMRYASTSKFKGIVETNATETVTPNVEYIGSGQIIDGRCEVDISNIIGGMGLNYFIQITPIGNKHIYLSEKNEDNFIVEGDDCSFDYLIKVRLPKKPKRLRKD